MLDRERSSRCSRTQRAFSGEANGPASHGPRVRAEATWTLSGAWSPRARPKPRAAAPASHAPPGPGLHELCLDRVCQDGGDQRPRSLPWQLARPRVLCGFHRRPLPPGKPARACAPVGKLEQESMLLLRVSDSCSPQGGRARGVRPERRTRVTRALLAHHARGGSARVWAQPVSGFSPAMRCPAPPPVCQAPGPLPPPLQWKAFPRSFSDIYFLPTPSSG